MEFYEECDKVLIYLKGKTSSLPHENINLSKYENETGISIRGAAFSFAFQDTIEEAGGKFDRALFMERFDKQTKLVTKI